MQFFENKNILVTGGTGSIGSLLVKELLKFNPKVIRIFDNSEVKLFEMGQELRKHGNVRFLLGDIRDQDRLRFAVNGVDLVFHTAALKHVDTCEFNPFEAVKTNILGLQNLINVCIAENVSHFLFTSSDKAVNPCNVMGTTKLLGEKLVTSANYYKGKSKTRFSSVRFGNVIGSSGSIIPLLRKQIMSGGPITITDFDMTRFAMSDHDAVNLILEAAAIMNGGEVFVLKMPAFRLADLVDVTLSEFAPMHGYKESDIPVDRIETKPGEKLHEELMTQEESERALETDNMFIILPEIKELHEMIEYNYSKAKKAKKDSYSSKDSCFMTKDEIRSFLRNMS